MEAVRLDDRQSVAAVNRLLSRHPALTTALIVVAGLLAGCGASSDAGKRAGCPGAPGSALSRAVGVPRAVASRPQLSPGVSICRYAAGSTRVRVTVDSAPQAYLRWNRAQVERWQTAAGWSDNPGQAPKVVAHLGKGAFWVTAPRELVATDGRHIVTVRVLAGAPARRIAVRVARAALRRH